MQLQNLGIEQISPWARFVGQTATTIANIDQDQDKKVSLAEALNALQIIGLKAFSNYTETDWQEFKAQIKDVDPQEVKQLIADMRTLLEL